MATQALVCVLLTRFLELRPASSLSYCSLRSFRCPLKNYVYVCSSFLHESTCVGQTNEGDPRTSLCPFNTVSRAAASFIANLVTVAYVRSCIR